MPHRFNRLTLRTITGTMLLVLLLWPAPRPVGHRHGECGTWSHEQMTKHLQFCHGGFANADNWPSDWHWHWCFPADPVVGMEGDTIAFRSILPVDGKAQMRFDAVCECHLDARVWQQTVKAQSIPAERRHSFTTTSLLMSRRSLPELLGVVRC